MDILHNVRILAEYNCGTYGGGTYQGACTTTTTTNNSPIDDLANTGYDVLIPLFLALSLLAASIVLLVRRAMRRRRQQNAQV